MTNVSYWDSQGGYEP